MDITINHKGTIIKTTWKLQDAKSQFSQLVEEALHHGPQYVTRRGKDAVVIVSVREYEALTPHTPTFKEFLLSCPILDEPLDIERSKELPRSIVL